MAKLRTDVDIATPVAMLWDQILMLPIVGVVDSRRAQEIMETILKKIEETGSKVIILDILGVATVDSAVANHLVKITKACTLMGCQCVITGIASNIAQTLVHLGVELGNVVTRASLKDGLAIAFDIIGVEVRSIKSGQIKIKV